MATTPPIDTPTLRDRFRGAAASVSCAFGSPWALASALALVCAWAASGHYFGYSDGWQLVINTGTTIVTFLMAFLIQATQFRESKALHLKIDELLRAVKGARTGFVNVEDLDDESLQSLASELRQVGKSESIAPIAHGKSAVQLANAIDKVAGSAATGNGQKPRGTRRRTRNTPASEAPIAKKR